MKKTGVKRAVSSFVNNICQRGGHNSKTSKTHSSGLAGRRSESGTLSSLREAANRLFMKYAALAAAFLMTACSPPPVVEGDPVQTPPALSGDLTMEEQKSRMEACRTLTLRDFGELADDTRLLIRAEPMVLPSAFLRLSKSDQERFIELAACNEAAGMIGERAVTLRSSISGDELNVSSARNDRDWASY